MSAELLEAPECEVETLPVKRGLIDVIAYPAPLRLGVRTVMQIEHGLTISQILKHNGVDIPDKFDLEVSIGHSSNVVPREFWGRVKPKVGSQVIVRIVPQSSGGRSKGIGAILVGVLLIVAAFIFPPLAPFLLPAGKFALAFGISSTLNSLLAPSPPKIAKLSGTDNATVSPNLFIKGARNSANPFGVIPIVFGKNRITPYYGAVPYTETIGDDQYLHLLFVLGFGPLHIESLKLGEDDVEDKEGVSIEIFNGFEGDGTGKLYTQDVSQQDYSILIEHENLGAQIVTTAPGAEQIIVDLLWDKGLYYVNAKDGSRHEEYVDIKIETSPRNANSWTTKYNGRVQSKNPNPFVRSFSLGDHFDGGQYDIRVTRLSNDSHKDRVVSEFLISAVRTITFTPPISASVPPLAKVVMVIKATDQLNGVVDNFNCIATSLAPTAITTDLSITGGVYCRSLKTNAAVDLDEARSYQFKARFHTRGSANGGGFFQAGQPSNNQNLRAGQDFSLSFLDPAIDTGNKLCFRLGSTDSQALDVTWTQDSVFDNAFHNYAITYDGAALKIYIDGSLAVTQALSGLQTPESQVFLGRWWDGTYFHFFDGEIRDFAVWEIALSGAQVTAYMVTPPTGTETGLRTVAKVGDGTGNIAKGTNGYAYKINATSGLENDGWIAAPDRTETGEPLPSQNPADMYRLALQGPGNSKPIADDRIDVAGLAAWATYCDDQGFKCNIIQDTATTLYQLLQDIAQAGGAGPTLRDTGYGVVIDRASAVVVGQFAPRNSRNFKSTKVFIDQPDALRVRFINEAKSYGQDERIVYNDDQDGNMFTADNAQVFTEYERRGTTDADSIYKFARRRLAEFKLRPEVYSLDVDIEGMRYTRGDRVKVAHDVMLEGTAWGRIKSLGPVNGSGDLYSIEIDEAGSYDSAKDYAVRIQLNDSTAIDANINNPAEDVKTLTFATPIAAATAADIEPDNLVIIGVRGSVTEDLIIKEIISDVDLNFTLLLVDYNEAIYNADTETIPEFNPNITLPAENERLPVPPVIRQIISDESVLLRGLNGVFIIQAAITFDLSAGFGAPIGAVQFQYRVSTGYDAPWDITPEYPFHARTVYITGVEQGRTYDFRMRSISKLGAVSNWSMIFGSYIIGMGTPPPTPVYFELTMIPNGIKVYQWQLGNVPVDVIGAVIGYGLGSGVTWDDMTRLHDAVLTTSPYPSHLPIAGGLYTFGIKSIDAQGNLSTLALYIESTIAEMPIFGFLYWLDVKMAIWPGTKTGCRIDTDNNLIATDSTTWATTPVKWALWTSWNMSPATLVYEHTKVNLGTALYVLPAANIAALGTVTLEMNTSADDITYTGWTAFAAVTAQYVKMRVSVAPDPGGGEPIPIITKLILEIADAN